MDTDEAISQLKQIAELSAVYHVTEFQCFRKTPEGEIQMVTVRILDAGPEADAGRYLCRATTEDGRAADGNSHDSLPVAIARVSWWKLDKPPSPHLAR